MPDEILYAGLANERTAETLTGDFLFNLTDRNMLPAHDALLYWKDFRGLGTTTVKIPIINFLGFDLPSQIGEMLATPNTPWADSSVLLSIGCFTKAYERGDLARFTDSLGVVSNPALFAEDAALSHSLRLANLCTNVLDDFTTTVGSTGADLTIAQFLAGVNLLEINTQGQIAPGQACSILHPVQMGDIRTGLLTLAGSAQYHAAAQDLLAVKGTGYRGQLFDVDLYSLPSVPTANAGADRAGSIFVRGAMCWGDMSVDTENDANSLVIGSKVLFERERKPRTRSTNYLSSSYLAASKLIDLCGISVITDA